MISRIDYLAIAVHDADAVGEAFRLLLGREPTIQDGLGARRIWFRFPNVALEVLGPTGDGLSGDRLRARLDAAGEGLSQLGFRVGALEDTAKRLTRRGLTMDLIEAMRPFVAGTANGISIGLVTPRVDPLSTPVGPETATVAGLDHLLVHTPNPDRALATYGARLGLDLRLDSANAPGDRRRIVFDCGESVIEISSDVKATATDGPDRLEGLAWCVSDAEAARARLAARFDVSEIRGGREPGARVFTVRDAPAGVPTTMIQPAEV